MVETASFSREWGIVPIGKLWATLKPTVNDEL